MFWRLSLPLLPGVVMSEMLETTLRNFSLTWPIAQEDFVANFVLVNSGIVIKMLTTIHINFIWFTAWFKHSLTCPLYHNYFLHLNSSAHWWFSCWRTSEICREDAEALNIVCVSCTNIRLVLSHFWGCMHSVLFYVIIFSVSGWMLEYLHSWWE